MKEQDKDNTTMPVTEPVTDRPHKDYALNPLLEEGPDGVILRVICIMEYLSCMTLQEEMAMNDNMHYGRWLIDESMINALKYIEAVETEKQKTEHGGK